MVCIITTVINNSNCEVFYFKVDCLSDMEAESL